MVFEIILTIIIVIQVYVIINLLVKTEKLETWVETFTQQVIKVQEDLNDIDQTGAFKSDDEVGSIAIEKDGDVDPNKLNAWLGTLLRERGIDIFRMKGFISIVDEPNRFVFQGVHMLFDGQPNKPWGDSPRRNQLVFIGRNLDEADMRKGFDSCLV